MSKQISKERLAGMLFFVLVGTAVVSVAAREALRMIGRPSRVSPPPLAEGAAAPQFELESLAGETVSLDQFRNRPVLVMFWGSS